MSLLESSGHIGLYLSLVLGLSPNFSFSQSPKYCEDIRTIVLNSCLPCHSGFNVGTMPLNTYEDLTSYAQMVVYVTQNRIMPPWKSLPSHPPHRNARILSVEEIQMFQDWVEAGMPMGSCPSRKDTALLSQAITSDSKAMICMEQSFSVKDDYKEHSQVFVLDNPFQDNIVISELNFVPGTSRLVKSCSISVDSSAQASFLDAKDPKYGYTNYGGVGFQPSSYAWYYWMAGDSPTKLEAPLVKQLSADSKILMNITYMPTRLTLSDSSCLEIRKSNLEVHEVIKSGTLIDTSHLLQKPFMIKPNEYRRFHAIKKLDKEVDLHAIRPHGMNVCVSWHIYAELPSGDKVDLLQIPKWDSMWQRKYNFETAIKLPEGTLVHALASYDNTEENGSIPVFPPSYIYHGESRKKELFLVQYDYID